MKSKWLVLLPILLLFIFGVSITANAATGTSIDIDGLGIVKLPHGIMVEQAKEKNNNYDLSKYDGDYWHYARLTVYNDAKAMQGLTNILNADVNGLQLQQISLKMKSYILGLLGKENCEKILVEYPAEIGFVANQRAWIFAYSMILTEEFPLPMYARFYVYSNQDKPCGILLFCADSDRKVWDQSVKTMLQSL